MLHIALPIVLSNLLAVGMQLTDIGFVGRIGKTELGAAALGNTVFYLLHYPMLGVMTAIDTLLATTFGAGHMRVRGLDRDEPRRGHRPHRPGHGAHDGRRAHAEGHRAGRRAERPGGLLLRAAGVGHTAVLLVPGVHQVPAVATHPAPPVYMGIVANVFNVILNWILIFGPANMGFRGAPIATSACRWFQMLLALAYAGWWRTRDASTRPRRWLMRRDQLLKLTRGFWKLAGPGAVMLLIEAWSFEITTLLAGYLGTVALDAHLTMLQLATLAFLSLPFAGGHRVDHTHREPPGRGRRAARQGRNVRYFLHLLRVHGRVRRCVRGGRGPPRPRLHQRPRSDRGHGWMQDCVYFHIN